MSLIFGKKSVNLRHHYKLKTKIMRKVGFLIAALFLTALTLLTLIRTNN